MDNKATFGNGRSVSKRDFQDLLRKVNSEVTCGYRISEFAINVVQSDRQKTKYMRDVFNLGTSSMFKSFFPNDPNKLELANLIENIDEVCNMYCSRKVYDDENKQKSALGTYLDKQIPALRKLEETVDKMKFDGSRMPFQNAIKICVNTAINLQELLKKDYDIDYLMLSLITQDHVESLFSVIRALFGAECKPSPLDCMKRLDHILLDTFLKDPNFDIWKLKEALETIGTLKTYSINQFSYSLINRRQLHIFFY